MLRDVNRDPCEWRDESGRVRVIEGWHPSDPERVGFNVLLDGSWLGTFDTLDSAAAATRVQLHGGGAKDRIRQGHGTAPAWPYGPRLRLVDPVADD